MKISALLFHLSILIGFLFQPIFAHGEINPIHIFPSKTIVEKAQKRSLFFLKKKRSAKEKKGKKKRRKTNDRDRSDFVLFLIGLTSFILLLALPLGAGAIGPVVFTLATGLGFAVSRGQESRRKLPKALFVVAIVFNFLIAAAYLMFFSNFD